MTKVIIILLIIVVTVTIFLVIVSNEKKWPMITITSLLIVELILCVYADESMLIHEITGMEYVFILLFLWILAIAPHVDNAIEKFEKNNDTTTDQNDKAGRNLSLFSISKL